MPENRENPSPCLITSSQKKLLKVLNCVFKNSVVNKTTNVSTFLANPSRGANDPSSIDFLYRKMATQVQSIVDLLNCDDRIDELITEKTEIRPTFRIYVVDTNGAVVYDSAVIKPLLTNTFLNYTQKTELYSQYNANGELSNSVTALKVIENLNVDENLEYSWNVRPYLSISARNTENKIANLDFKKKQSTIWDQGNPGLVPKKSKVFDAFAPSSGFGLDPVATSNTTNPIWVTEAMVAMRTGCPGVSNTGFIILTLEVDINDFEFKSGNPILSCFGVDKKN